MADLPRQARALAEEDAPSALIHAFSEYMFFLNPLIVLDRASERAAQLESISENFLSLLRSWQACRGDQDSWLATLRQDFDFQGPLNQLSTFLHQQNMASILDYVHTHIKTTVDCVRNWSQEWIMKRHELPDNLDLALDMFFNVIPHDIYERGILTPTSEDNHWSNAILRSRSKVIDALCFGTEFKWPEVGLRHSLPADIATREMSRVVDQITDNFLTVLLQIANQRHLVHKDNIIRLPLTHWYNDNVLLQMIRKPSFGLRDRAELSRRVGSYLVENHRYQPDPRPFGLPHFQEFMHIWYGDDAEAATQRLYRPNE